MIKIYLFTFSLLFLLCYGHHSNAKVQKLPIIWCDSNKAKNRNCYIEVSDRKPRYEESSRKYLRRECDMKSKTGCSRLATLEKNTGNYEQAIKYYELACEMNAIEACHNLGVFHYTKARNNEQALKHYRMACDSKFAPACNSVGMLTKRKDTELAREYFEMACDLKYPKGCVNLGFSEEEAGNEWLARKYYKKACDLNYLKGCAKLVLRRM